MKTLIYLSLIGGLLVLSSGCATSSTGGNQASNSAPAIPAYIAQEANTAPQTAASYQGMPGSLKQATPPANVQQEPVPIWEPAQVVRVELAPYVNEKGEAFPASYKYVVVKGGSFNSSALERPEQAYIPADNIPQVPGNPAMTYSRMVSPGSAAVSQGATGGSVGVQPNLETKSLYDLSQVMILGLFEASQGSEAHAMVPEDYTPVYDENLGWIGIPKSHLMGVGEIQSNNM